MDKNCTYCNGSGWVDENDRAEEWVSGPEQGAGAPCDCNPDAHYEFAVIYASVSDEVEGRK